MLNHDWPQVEKVQKIRIEAVKNNLLRYLDTLWAETTMFDMHIRNMAEQKLATAEYGPVMLVTLGKVYKLSAKQAQGNMVAFFKYGPLCHVLCQVGKSGGASYATVLQAAGQQARIHVVCCISGNEGYVLSEAAREEHGIR